MIDLPKPVLSCFGHESLVSELESQLMQSIASEPVLWRHSKWTPPYPVHIDVYFTRFDPESFQVPVKVLSTGRPIRPLGSMKPFLYILVLSNNHTQYTSGTVKQDIAKWLGHLNAQNITDWLILVIDANSQLGASKVWPKLNVLDRIKQDFNVPTSGHHFLRVPDRRAVEEKVFSESWNSLMRTFRKILLDIFHQTIQDYDTHIRFLLDAQSSTGWDFFEYLDRKEELAELYLFLRGYEDALHEYYDIELLFASTIRTSISGSACPSWVEHLRTRSCQSAHTCSFLSCFPVINSSLHSHQAQAVRNRSATLFDIRTYLLSKQSILLKSLKRLHDFPVLALSRMVAAVQGSRILQVCSVSEFEYCWTLLCILDCLQLIRPKSISSDDLTNIPNSITSLLAMLPESTCHRSDQTVPSFISSSALPDEFGSSRPLQNVFLLDNHPVSPLAEPLAKVVARTHTIIASIATSPEHLLITGLPDRRHSFSSYLVDMWMVVLLQLVFLGQRLSFWSPSHDHAQCNPILQSIKASINQCSLSHFTNVDDFAVSVHRHLTHLLSSKTTYSEVYISLAQVILGFLNLISHPRKSIYVSCLLANFLQYTNNELYACDLYLSATSLYLNESWIHLGLRTYLQLACCLRVLLDDARFRNSRELEFVIVQYIDCCFTLACSPSEVLSTVTNSMNVAASQEISLNTWFPKKSVTSVVDFHSPQFWRSELVRALQLLSEPLMLDASFALSTPFRISEVHLRDATGEGTQCLTLQLKNTSNLFFKVRIQMTAAFPTMNDWSDVMECGFMGELDRDVDDAETELIVVDYTQKTHPVNTSDLSSRLSSLDIGHSVSLAPKPGLTRLNADRPQTDTVNSSALRKRNSFLDVAASWAARPTWKSQDHLHSPHGKDSNPPHKNQSMRYRPSSVSTLVEPSVCMADRLSRFSVVHRASTSNLQNNTPLSTDSVLYPDGIKEYPFLRQSSSVVQRECAISFVPQHSTLDGESTVTLCPGMNAIDLVATCPGFMLPVCLRITILDWFGAPKNISHETPCSDNVQLDLCYAVQRHNFSSSWKNGHLLHSLLPSIHNHHSTSESFEPITVILGVKQPVLFDIDLGKLGLPTTSCSPITLYRYLPAVKRNHSPLRNSVSEPARKVRGSSDYMVTPLTERIASVADKGDSTSDQLTNGPIDSDYIHLDGPVDLFGNSHRLTNFPANEYFPAASQLQLNRPLILSVLSEMDQFAISMPFGYMYNLPVRIIKPLTLQLSVSTFQRTNAVIFCLRIGCSDLADQVKSKHNANNNADSLVFMLSGFQMTLNTPSIQDEAKPYDLPNSPRGISVTPRQVLSSQTVVHSASVGPLADNFRSDTLDTLVGSLLDPYCDTVYVSPLCPVALLWQFKFSEFRPFINATRERLNKSPVAKFQCNFRLLGDMDSEAQLVFYRKISPVTQPKIEKPVVTTRFLGRSKKTRS